jgi:hypothetical protein
MEKKIVFESYETPVVELVEVEVEKGFAQSNTEGFGPWEE